jgi:ABC-2 type transport system permease protein
MTRVNTLVAKELRSYFVSPVVYVVGAVFLLIVGLLAYIYIVFTGAQAIQLMQVQGKPKLISTTWCFEIFSAASGSSS